MLSNQARSMSIFWRVLMQSMQARGLEVRCCVPDGEDLTPLEKLGYPVLTCNLDRKGVNPLHDLKTFFELKKLLLAQKPDILFATTIKPVIYGCLAAHWAHVPRIYATITGLGYAFEADTPFKQIINKISCRLYSASLRHATGIFFQNQDDAGLFRREGILAPDARIFFARGTGVDTSYFAEAPLPPLDPGASIVFLLVGRLLEAKGIYDYIKAAQKLKGDYPKARFQILGLPETGRGSVAVAQLKRFEPVIEYLGQARDVRPYFTRCHVAVLPSWREGTPTALMEAMSMGRPLVATDVPGCREVVQNGVNGFLAISRNPDSLALAMSRFLAQPELVKSMGSASRALAVSEFEAQKVADKILRDMGGGKP